MAHHSSIRQLAVQGIGALSLAMGLAHGALAAHAAPAARTVSLVGTWLGNALGNTGRCGPEYGQFTFFRNGEYAYTENSADCGGITNAGYFSVRAGVLTLHWVECNYPCSAGTASAAIRLITTSTFALYDGGQAYYYTRQ